MVTNYALPAGYYLGLLTSEYRQSTNLNAWLAAVLSPLTDATDGLWSTFAAFDLSSAVGVQLDALGVIIGASRTVNFTPSGGVSPVLDDATYRLLLASCIAQNQWDGKIDSLQTIWQTLFPSGRIVIDDNENMSATVILTGAFTSIIQDLIVNGYIVPRPQAVLYNFTFSTLPAFGFDSSPGFVEGFDTGHWS